MHGFFSDSSSAVFSPCGLYRYRLDRTLVGKGPVVSITMVNPSFAGSEVNDPTIRKLIGFCQRLRASRFIVTNKFAHIATDVRQLAHVDHPVGPQNDQHLGAAFAEADIHVVAWGPLTKLPPVLRNRWRRVLYLLSKAGASPQCWGTAKGGHPRHPLMLAYSTALEPWGRPNEEGS